MSDDVQLAQIVGAAPDYHPPARSWPEVIPWNPLEQTPPPWPWDAFPTLLADYGRAVTEIMIVSDEMAGVSILGVLSISLGNRAKVIIKSGHWQYGNIYVFIAVPPAGKKSPLAREIAAPIWAWQKEETAKFQERLQEYKAQKKAFDAKVKGLESAISKAARGGNPTDELVDPEKDPLPNNNGIKTLVGGV